MSECRELLSVQVLLSEHRQCPMLQQRSFCCRYFSEAQFAEVYNRPPQREEHIAGAPARCRTKKHIYSRFVRLQPLYRFRLMEQKKRLAAFCLFLRKCFPKIRNYYGSLRRIECRNERFHEEAHHIVCKMPYY